MAYTGKYRDNFPYICAAGLQKRPNYSCEDSLKRHTLEDEINALKADFQVSDKEYKSIKLPKTSAVTRTPGIFIESRELLRPPSLSRYRQLIRDLRETTYSSYWKKKLGKTPDCISAFPEGSEIEDKTYGKPNTYDCSVKDLIQPDKTPYQVLWDSQINHNVYKKVYGSYNPGERIERGYDSSSFCPSQAFGKYNGYDQRGLKAKCCLEWYNNYPLTIVTEVQSKWTGRNKRKLGECHDPDRVLEYLPNGHTFGIPNRRDMYGVDELLKEPNTPISTEARDVRTWLVSLNRLKMKIEEKICPTFDFNVLHEKLKFFDKEKTGMIRFAYLLEVLKNYEIYFNIKNVKALMEFVGIIVKDFVDYKKFVEALKGKLPLQKIDIPVNNSHFVSTYQAACCDLLIPDENILRSTAGIPTRRLDEPKPASPYSDQYVQMADFTDVQACLQPSIFTQFSLSHRDFYCPREKNFMRGLFQQIDDENFEKLWKIGTERDCSKRVCVQTFRDLLNELFPRQRKLKVDGV